MDPTPVINSVRSPLHQKCLARQDDTRLLVTSSPVCISNRDNCDICTQCGETGHVKHFCTASTWCKFCVMGSHSTQAYRKYANLMRDNPMASSRRTTPVQDEMSRNEGWQQRGGPPVERFQPPVVPLVDFRRRQQPVAMPRHTEPERSHHEQKNSQDVLRDPHFQQTHSSHPLRQQLQPPPIAVNEMGPTIQGGVIQRPVRQEAQPVNPQCQPSNQGRENG